MYETSPDLTVLRQGDVISNIVFPKFSLKEMRLLYKVEASENPAFGDEVILKTSTQFAAVLSQCCEFNEGKRKSFSLARIVGLGERTHPALRVFGVNLAEIVPWNRLAPRQRDLEALLRANSVEADRPQHVNVYTLRPDGQHLAEPHLVDFSRVFSVHIAEKERVLARKVLQLDSSHRREFQLKLAYFYARSAEDDDVE
jgi:hypothetical protein